MLNFTFVWWWQLTWRKEWIPDFTTTKSEVKIKSMQEDKFLMCVYLPWLIDAIQYWMQCFQLYCLHKLFYLRDTNTMILRLVFQLLRAEKDYYVQICLGSIQNYEKKNQKRSCSDLMTSREQKNKRCSAIIISKIKQSCKRQLSITFKCSRVPYRKFSSCLLCSIVKTKQVIT